MELPNLTKIFGEATQIKVKSITDSIFKFGVMFFALGVISAIFKTKEWLYIVLFSVGGLLMLVGLAVYIYFTKKNPDYLRSEEYQLKKQSITLLGDKDNMFNPNVKSVPMITNPFLPESKVVDNE